MAIQNEILVYGEIVDGQLTTVTKELLKAGRKLSDELAQPLISVLIGKDIQEVAEKAIVLGADKVYVTDGSLIDESPVDSSVAILTEACQQIAPSVVILGQTDMGRDIAPRLAARLGTVATMDCVGLAIEPDTKRLLQTKPVYGGNAMAIWVSESHEPQIVTLRPRSVMPAEADTSRSGEVIPLNITVDESKIKSRLVETAKEEGKGIKLEEAKAIVAGGGGLGSADGLRLLEELAEVLGGTVGVSRVPCDEGWAPISIEIGQTGHIVGPSLYIAVGISGAAQHMTGCQDSKCIVAINKDPEAHIFKEADFGVVGDYRQVLPALTNKCKALLAV